MSKETKKPPIPEVRAIQLKNVPGELQPLVAMVMQLEATIIKGYRASSRTLGSTATELIFSPIMDDLTNVKKECLNLIQQLKALESG